MNTIVSWIEETFGALPLPLLEVWGRLGYCLGFGLMVCAFGGFTLRPGGRWGLGRERQAWDAKAFLSIPLTFILIIVAGYVGSFIVLVPGAQTFESLKDLVVFLCIVLFGYPALITVPFAYGLSDLIEGVPPLFLLDWLPGYFINPTCFWIAYQLFGRDPDFRRARTWGRYLGFVLVFMAVEPVLWGYICSDKFTPELAFRTITPALFFTTGITWLIAPAAMLGALPLARQLGLFWADIPGHVKERVLGRREWIWESGPGGMHAATQAAESSVPIRMLILAPFIVLVLLMVGATAYVTLRSAAQDADRLATRLHQEIAENINLQLDEQLSHPGAADDAGVVAGLLGRLPVSAHGRAFIMDRSGRTIASSAPPDDPVVAAAISQLGQTVSGRLERLPPDRQFRFTRVNPRPLSRETWLARATAYQDRSGGHGDWLVVTAMPEAYYLAGVRAGNSRSAMIFALALLLSLAVAAVLASKVTAPIRRISIATRALADGDLDQQLPGSPLEELDVLTRSFNDMAGRLKKNFDDLSTEVEMRKRAERRLLQERDYADTVLNSLPGAFYHFDEQGRFLRWNRNFEKVTGYSAAELAAMRPQDFFPEGERELIAAKVAEVFARGQSQAEAEFLLKGGRRIPYLFTGVRFDHDGRRDLVGIGADIEAQKRTQDALRESLARFHAAARATRDVVWDWDLATNTIWWNENFQTLFGYSAEEIDPGIESWTGRLHPEDRDRVIAHIHAVIDGTGETWSDEYRFRRKDGSYADIFDRGHVLRDASGRGVRMVGAMQDVSERKQKDAALRRVEDNIRRERALLRALIDSISDLVFFKDKNLAFLGCNRAFENYLGVSESQLIGKTDFDIVSGEWAAYYRDQDQKLFASGQPQRTEEKIPGTDGRAGTFDTIKTPFYGQNGELLGLLGVSRDITERKQMEEALRQERDYSDSILNSLPGVFYHFDDSLRFLRWNKNLERVTGYSAGELEGMHPMDFFVEQEKALVASRIGDVLEKGEAQVEADYLLKDGRRIPYLFTGVRFEHGGRKGFVGVGTDIEGLKKMEEALREKTALFEAQVESSIAGIHVVDRHGRKVIQNRRLNEIWKLPPDLVADPNVAPQRQFAAQRTKNPAEFIARIAWLDAHPDEIGHDEIELVDGSVVDLYSAPVRDREGRYYGRIWIHNDITERKQAERRISYLATHDGLTDLPNRNLIQDRIAQAVAHARRTGRQLALLYLDLDRFKVINDGYGHPFGDAVLKATSERLVTLVREGDTVARLGGDEFLVLLTDLRKATDAYIVARKIVESLDRPVAVQDREIHLSGSIGVSVFPQDGETADVLIGNADVAMYRAKDLGRNTYQFFTREMSEETQRRIDLETRLRGAAAAGQLELAYQPKVSLESGRVTGCEALLRWHHPELGAVSPARFIPIAEDSGLIVPVGEWVLQAACSQARAWLDAGLPPVCVAVNISARQFLQQDVVAWVMRTLRDTGLPPEQLELELTESLIAQDVEKVIATIRELRARGVKLSIDDFGTGYSSLSYLKRFRVDTLKIDRSFVRNMLTEAEDATIVLAVISLAHNLGFKVIAEGVETEQHCRFLRLNRCDEIQGYYFSQPVPAAQFEAMLRGGKQLP